MKTAIPIMVSVLFLGMAIAEAQVAQKYNPMSNKWETTYPDSKLRYNPVENEWNYVSPRLPARPDNLRTIDPPDREVQPSFNFNSGKFEFPK